MKAWVLAARPKTLALAFSIAVFSQLWVSKQASTFEFRYAVLVVLCALCLQVAVNIANDLFDGLSGVDQADRLGPPRALANGWLQAKEMTTGLILIVLLAITLGLPLIFLRPHLLWLGLASIIGVFAYSWHGKNIANLGLGELVSGLFFGPVLVLGGAWVQHPEWDLRLAFLSIAIGALVASVMLVNNVRDRVQDQRADKTTLAVRMGRRGSEWLYLMLWLGASLTFAGFISLWLLPSGLLLSLVLYRQLHLAEGRTYNRVLASTSLLSSAYILLAGAL